MQMLTYWGVESILSLRLEYVSVTVVTEVHLKEKQSRKEEALGSLEGLHSLTAAPAVGRMAPSVAS